METVTKILLVLLYPLLVLGRLLNVLLGRDPLRLREPRDTTCWIVRDVEVGRLSYFSEASKQEGRNHGGCGWLATKILRMVSRLCAPPRATGDAVYRPTLERDQDIPDEVYTLW